MNFNGKNYEHSELVAAGGSSIIELPSKGPAALAIHASAGAQVSLSVCLSPKAALAAGDALFCPVAAYGTNGTLTAGIDGNAFYTDIPAPLTAIRVDVSVGSAVVEVLQ